MTERDWKPALERIMQPRTAQPLGPNRAMRRAAAKKDPKTKLGTEPEWKALLRKANA